jgi:hypothetical protein
VSRSGTVRLRTARALAFVGFVLTTPGFATAQEPPADTVSALQKTAPHDTAAAAAAALPRARYFPLARLEGFRMPDGDPWAPDRSALLLVRRDGLFVFEATRPTEQPQRILEAQILSVCWSPDGSWVGCRVRVPTVVRSGDVRLQFVSAAGGPVETRTPRARVGPFLWAEDGAIYFWDAKRGTRSRIEPPRSWSQRQPRLPEARPPYLVLLPDRQQGGRERAVLFTPAASGRPAVEVSVPGLVPPAARNLKVADVFPAAAPDGARFLVHLQPANEGLRTFTLDSRGDRLARLGQVDSLPAFVGTSVSADGRYVAGYRPRQGAGTFAASAMWLADASGRWSVPVEDATHAVAVRVSHFGAFVAFEDPLSNTDLIHVGRVDVKPLP